MSKLVTACVLIKFQASNDKHTGADSIIPLSVVFRKVPNYTFLIQNPPLAGWISHLSHGPKALTVIIYPFGLPDRKLP